MTKILKIEVPDNLDECGEFNEQLESLIEEFTPKKLSKPRKVTKIEYLRAKNQLRKRGSFTQDMSLLAGMGGPQLHKEGDYIFPESIIEAYERQNDK